MQFHILDMTCGSCVSHIQKALTKIDPAVKIDADTVSRKLNVTSTASRHNIEAALADAGYPSTSI